jgi:hypothetical protein
MAILYGTRSSDEMILKEHTSERRERLAWMIGEFDMHGRKRRPEAEGTNPEKSDRKKMNTQYNYAKLS